MKKAKTHQFFFVKKLNIFERECNVPWERKLFHKDVTGFLDLRWIGFVREKNYPNLARERVGLKFIRKDSSNSFCGLRMLSREKTTAEVRL